MQIEARFRRRASVGESIPELNKIFLEQLSSIAGLWSDECSSFRFDAGNGESAATDISPCLLNGMRGAISYSSRLPAAIVDKAVSDDFITIQMDSSRVDFQWFCHDVFPRIVDIFRPYRACVLADLDIDLDDFEVTASEARRTGRDVDGRDSVYRLHPINYFDDAMCRRAFGTGPEEVARAFRGQIFSSKVVFGGVMLVISNEPSSGVLLSSFSQHSGLH